MIGRLHGILTELEGNQALIDVNGVGYELEVPIGTFDDVAMTTTCTVYVHQVHLQDAMVLFGFSNKPTREFFRVLIKIPSVGPKSALAILSTYSLTQLGRIARERDDGGLTRVKGIGKRSAERIVVELANMVDQLPLAVMDAIPTSSTLQEAESALVSLGYRLGEARKAVKAAWHEDISVEELVRNALQRLSH